jgi:hypothetical protein
VATRAWRVILIAAPLVVACAGPSKSDLDAEVRRLCAVDGGVKVYETAVVPTSMKQPDGRLRIPFKQQMRAGDAYYLESDTTYYRRGDPEMWRVESRVVRVRDGRVLGTSVRYSRRGGDVAGPWHPSSYTCPAISRDQVSLEEAVFKESIQ